MSTARALKEGTRRATITAITVFIVLGGVAAFLGVRGSTLVAITDPGDVHDEPFYAVFNPLRDRAPERAVEHVLFLLQDGRFVEAKTTLAAAAMRSDFITKEAAYPLRDWRLVSRSDSPNRVQLVYRLARHGDPRPVEPLFVDLTGIPGGGFRITSFITAY